MLACCACSRTPASRERAGAPESQPSLYDKVHAYWDNVDAARLPEDSLEQMTVDYLYLSAHLAPAERQRLWPDFFSRVPGHPLKTVVDYLGQSDSPLYSATLLTEYLTALTLYPADPAAQARAEYLLENLGKNPVGATIADLQLLEGPVSGVLKSSNRATTLHRLIGEAGTDCLIIFYDPDCEACDALLRQLAARPSASPKTIIINTQDKSGYEVKEEKRIKAWKTASIKEQQDYEEKFYHPTLPALYQVTPQATILTKPQPLFTPEQP